jgi:hypothetical protein
MPGEQTKAAANEFLSVVNSLEAIFREGEREVTDPQSVLDGYKWIFTMAEVAMKAYVWADPGRPRFVDIVGPYLKWGGDNADAFYQYAPIDPTLTYRVRGLRSDAVYFSLTVYGGPSDGGWSDHLVGTLNDEHVTFDADGGFEMMLSAQRPEGFDGAWLELTPDSVCAVTRDYTIHPADHRRVEWSIECLDGPTSYELTDAELARRFRAAATWVRDQTTIFPLAPLTPNEFDEPYPQPKVTVGWAAGDAAYAMGGFELAEDEALVIRGRSPECRFWNLCAWNRFLHTFNADYDQVTVNGGQVTYEEDGSWVIVVSATDPGHPNWVNTQGHLEGVLWFRWFLPSETPAKPACEVVPVASLR